MEKANWEVEFEKEFTAFGEPNCFDWSHNEGELRIWLKSFIRDLLEKTKKEAEEEYEKAIWELLKVRIDDYVLVPGSPEEFLHNSSLVDLYQQRLDEKKNGILEKYDLDSLIEKSVGVNEKQP